MHPTICKLLKLADPSKHIRLLLDGQQHDGKLRQAAHFFTHRSRTKGEHVFAACEVVEIRYNTIRLKPTAA